MKQYLKNFLEDKIDLTEFKRLCGGNLRTIIETPEIVSSKHVIDMINKYTEQKITKERLVDWVNVLWFTDLYDYADEEENSIASVMSCLETLDEEDVTLSKKDFLDMIKALSNNEEY